MTKIFSLKSFTQYYVSIKSFVLLKYLSMNSFTCEPPVLQEYRKP